MKPLTPTQQTELSLINMAANSEGWNIYLAVGAGANNEDEWRIERHDDMKLFDGDKEAIVHIIKKCKKGSDLHQRTVAFMLEHGSLEELRIIIAAVSKIKIS